MSYYYVFVLLTSLFIAVFFGVIKLFVWNFPVKLVIIYDRYVLQDGVSHVHICYKAKSVTELFQTITWEWPHECECSMPQA